MSDKAWETASAGWPDIMRETPEIRQAFDAGRASRDIEVSGYDRDLLDSENEINRLERELASATVRAAAAENTVKNLRDWAESDLVLTKPKYGEYGEGLHTAQQVVLALIGKVHDKE